MKLHLWLLMNCMKVNEIISSELNFDFISKANFSNELIRYATENKSHSDN